jgi:hypothetical protein
MTHFAQTYPTLYKKMLNCKYMMFFAISSINISHMIYVYFQFLPDGVVPPPEFSVASDETVGVLKRLLNMRLDVFNDIYSFVLMAMYYNWIKLNEERDLTVMDFGLAVTAAQEYLKSVMAREYVSPKELRDHLESALPQVDSETADAEMSELD